MSRGQDRRPPRRRGFDDDNFEPPRASTRPPPRFSGGGGGFREETPSGPPITATVKWFNAEKGFGFVEVSDGSGDAFLHIAVLERSGHAAVEPGTTLQVRIGQGQKGPQVAEVLEVDASTAGPEAPRRDRAPMGGARPPRPGGQGRSFSGETTEMRGTVKWYNAAKGFGFIAVDGGGKDVFVHASALERSGMRDLAEGQSVRMQVGQGQKGPEAVSISAG